MDQQLHIETDKDHGAMELIISDLTGKIILQQKVSGNGLNLDLSGLQKGIYLVQLSGEEIRFIEQIVKSVANKIPTYKIVVFCL